MDLASIVSIAGGFTQGACEAKGIQTGLWEYALLGGPIAFSATAAVVLVYTEDNPRKEISRIPLKSSFYVVAGYVAGKITGNFL